MKQEPLLVFLLFSINSIILFFAFLKINPKQFNIGMGSPVDFRLLFSLIYDVVATNMVHTDCSNLMVVFLLCLR